MRMGVLDIGGVSLLREGDLDAGSLSGERFYLQIAAEDTDTLFDYRRSLTRRFQFGQGLFSGEIETAPVVLYLQRPSALVDAEADQDPLRAAVLAHVGKRLLGDADQLAT